MTDRAGILAAGADVLTEMCAYYIVAGVLIMGRSGWGVHLIWLLLCPAVCMAVFGLLMKKPRGVPFLTVLTLVLFAACLAVYIAVSTTAMKFGYIFVLVIGAGMSVGLPLNYMFHRPDMHTHLTHLDVLILALAGLLLAYQALGIDTGTIALMVAVLFLVAGSAIGLRMAGDGAGSGDSTLKASLVALGAAVGVFVIVLLLTMLFSRSGGVTSAVLHGIGAFFAAVGGGIERFVAWLASLIHINEQFDAIDVPNEMPSLANAEVDKTRLSLPVNGTVVGIVAAVVVIALAVLIAVLLRKKKLRAVHTDADVPVTAQVVRHSSSLGRLWSAFLARLRFDWTAFVRRGTPAGLLVRLERKAKRAGEPRLQGEPMRHFITRMAPDGSLNELADALDRLFYGSRDAGLTRARCRELGRIIGKKAD